MLLITSMKRSLEAVAPAYDRPLIIKVGDQVDIAAMAETDSEPIALYYRRNTATRAFPLRAVMLVALFFGCGGLLAFLIHFATQGVTRTFLHLAGF